MRIAIVGAGISGLAVAHAVQGRMDLTLFESADYFGGHTHTVDITLPTEHGPLTHGVDTGFLVFNDRTYPKLIALFADLGVASAESEMSFSVQVPDVGLEWSGASLSAVFAQRRNLLNWRFLRMLRDLLRFNSLTSRLAEAGAESELLQPLGEFLLAQGYGKEFQDWYLLPMLACIWSCPPLQMQAFPVATMIRFCHNHGLLQIRNRPQWRTVTGGARSYVERIVSRISDKRRNTPVLRIERDAQGVSVFSGGRVERFDKLVIATHSDEALALLSGASAQERSLLGAIRYQTNLAVLHTDAGVLPRNKAAWAAWNFEHRADEGAAAGVCLHYLINRLQPLPFSQPVLVSLNPVREIARKHEMGRFNYAHPVFDLAALRAQADLPLLQGRQHTYFCGAWTGYGFHEDGLRSGQQVARQLLIESESAVA